MPEKPTPKWEIERSLALYFEEGNFELIRSIHSTAYGYMIALKRARSANAMENTD